MRKLTRKNWIELAVMTVIFVVAAVLVYKTTIVKRMIMPAIETVNKAEEGCLYKLASGDKLEQSFIYDEDRLLSAGMQITINEDELHTKISKEVQNEPQDYGTLYLDIIDAEGNKRISTEYDVRILDDGQNLLASFPTAESGFMGQEITIVLEAENIDKDLELSVGYNTKEKKNTALTINGEEQAYTLNIQTASHQFLYWKQWTVFGAALVYLLLLGTYLGFAVLRAKPQNVFLFTGSILAILYMLLIPPFAVPDEGAHFKEAYRYANQMMGKTTEENKLVIDKEDYYAMKKFETTPSLTEYDVLKEEIGKSGRTEGTKEIKYSSTQAPFVTYLPGILGITAGRLLGMNGIMVIFLGRICAVLCYLFMMYWFIRLMPCGKAAAFMMAILPMTIQQCCSYSYDSIVIETAFVFLALLFGLLYKKEPIQKWQMAVYLVCVIILSISKGGTYMFLGLLTIMLPVCCFKNKKQKWLFTGGMALAACIAFLSSTLSYALYVAAPTEEQAAGSYLAGEAYGLAGLLADPMNFICLTVRTILLSGDGFIETMLGMQLGWLNIFVSRIVIYTILFMMILSIMPVEAGLEKTQFAVTVRQKILYLFVSACSIGMVMASMFMSWTPKNSTAIAGIQGRYFLPLLPVLLLVFHSKNIVLKKDMSRKYMFIAVCLQCVAIYGILMSLERII